MTNPINLVKFTKLEQYHILKLLHKIQIDATNLAMSKGICNAEDIDDIEDIAKVAKSLYKVLDKKFNVESTPQKGSKS